MWPCTEIWADPVRLNSSAAEEIVASHLRAKPDDHAVRFAFVRALNTSQRYDDAERYLREAVRLSPQSVKANYQLGLLLARMGRKGDADKQLALAKSLRQEDESNARLQLRLLEHEP